MPRTEIKNSTNKPKAQGLPDKLEDFLGLKDYAEGRRGAFLQMLY
jgi:hypothetical protein